MYDSGGYKVRMEKWEDLLLLHTMGNSFRAFEEGGYEELGEAEISSHHSHLN